MPVTRVTLQDHTPARSALSGDLPLSDAIGALVRTAPRRQARHHVREVPGNQGEIPFQIVVEDKGETLRLLEVLPHLRPQARFDSGGRSRKAAPSRAGRLSEFQLRSKL